MTQYSIEVYNRHIEFIGFSDVVDYSISFDYLSQEKSSIIIENKSCQYNIGDFIKLINIGKTKPLYHGIISSVEESGNTKTLEVKHILSLFDVMVEFDRNKLKTTTLESFLTDIILRTYANNQDALQQIPIEVRTNSIGIFNATLNLKDNIHNLYEIILKSFEKYNLILHGEIIHDKLIFNIDNCNDKQLIFDMNLPIVLDKYIKLQNNSGKTNKITLINKENELEKRTYYLLNDNTITENINDSIRIKPAIFSYEYIEKDFAVQAEEIAKDRLLSSEYNDLIELLIIKDNKIIDVDSLKIGQKVIFVNNKTYINSIYTGYQTYKNNTIKLIFGKLRIDLTKILRNERG